MQEVFLLEVCCRASVCGGRTSRTSIGCKRGIENWCSVATGTFLLLKNATTATSHHNPILARPQKPNQNGEALTGTLVVTHPQTGRVQVPITSGIVSKDAVTFSGKNQFPLGGSIEIIFHGKVSGNSMTGTTDMTSRGLFGTVTNSGPLNLIKQ